MRCSMGKRRRQRTLAISEASGLALCAANTGTFLNRLNFPHVYGVAFSPDGRRIAASSGDSYAGGWAIWDVESAQEQRRVRMKNAAFESPFAPMGGL